MFEAVIFDMDGVLINSELYWDEEDKCFFGKRGVSFDDATKAKMKGKSMRENMQWVRTQFGFSESVEELCRERVNVTDNIYTQKSGIMPGVEPFLQLLRSHGVKTAIASGSFLYRIETIVDRFNWKQYFDTLVSSDHVQQVGKPDPAIYMYTSQKLGVEPSKCVVIEDSVNGVWAAKRAGMSCVAVPDPRWSYGDFSDADLIVSTLYDQKLSAFIGI